ncbi:YtxH domain-containing protein [Pyrinomonas methylaliphatogenes]|jgi:gas vesicle protein|uniref:Gas vesicle protein n=1 Tax=Pyrinomonas methylaliphatogenes TaxID=454194 RepID=A0A0B6X0K5_9BACT|nr:YtxH domain-containing protein [Pyrinomonas methylaliphatogenes]MBX5477459.1 YtxH domain-containing protein [Pyrinomonas methylaliphatogenes]CDM66876.1 gas vesicle protein [Pyrinomonas methylaliphatogenes]
MSAQEPITRAETGTELSTRLTYFLIGGTIGAIIALLFAPKPGRELRSDLADATRRGVDRTREAAAQLGAKAGEYYSTAAQKASELAEAAREAAARKGEQISAAIEAGKQAYVEEKRRTELSGAFEPES